jgi:hypothetical protein
MGIKPIKMPKSVKPDDAMTASEISNAEKAFYGNSASKTFTLQGGGSVSLEAKAPMKKITVCSSAPSRLKERRQLQWKREPLKYEPGVPMDGPPKDFPPPKEGSGKEGYGSGSGKGFDDDPYLKDMRDRNPFMKDVKYAKMKEPVMYADDFLYRSFRRDYQCRPG